MLLGRLYRKEQCLHTRDVFLRVASYDIIIFSSLESQRTPLVYATRWSSVPFVLSARVGVSIRNVKRFLIQSTKRELSDYHLKYRIGRKWKIHVYGSIILYITEFLIPVDNAIAKIISKSESSLYLSKVKNIDKILGAYSSRRSKGVTAITFAIFSRNSTRVSPSNTSAIYKYDSSPNRWVCFSKESSWRA